MTRLCLTSRRRGLSLVEIAFAAAILAIVAIGYLGALSTSVGVNVSSVDQTTADLLASREIELLRAVEFDELPYIATSDATSMEEVPDYLTNLIGKTLPPFGLGQAGSTGSQPEYPAELAVDGLRMDATQAKWVGLENGPFAVAGGGWPPELDTPSDEVIGGGGFGGVIGVPPIDVIDPTQPGTDVDNDSQLWWVNLRTVTRMHRILYDNRFNTYGDPDLETSPSPVEQKDFSTQTPGIYQRAFKVFASNVDLSLGIPFNPAIHEGAIIYQQRNLPVNSAGIFELWNNVASPLAAAVLGIGEIYTLCTSDPTFHYPYVGEVEAYGFRRASAYIPSYVREDGAVEEGNYVMFFPRYNGSDFDLARRVYWTPDLTVWPPQNRPNVARVEIEVMRHDPRRNTQRFIEQTWWQTDTSELVKYATVLYRDGEAAGGVLPELPIPGRRYPFDHTNYRSNEDFLKVITVPGAEALRLHFDIFGLQSAPDTDYIQIYDAQGNQYGLPQYFGTSAAPESLQSRYGPWVPGDTLVVRFVSDASGSSLPPANFAGVRADFVEINGLPEDPTELAADMDPLVAAMFERDVFPRLPYDKLPPERQQEDDRFFANPSLSSGTGTPEDPAPPTSELENPSFGGGQSFNDFLDDFLDDGEGF